MNVTRNVRRTVALAFAVALLSGCARYDEQTDVYLYRGAVARSLKDPDSAQFRNDRVWVHRDGSARLCGEVNAKNGFGGFAGYRRFIATKSAVQFESADNAMAAAEFKVRWTRECVPN